MGCMRKKWNGLPKELFNIFGLNFVDVHFLYHKASLEKCVEACWVEGSWEVRGRVRKQYWVSREDNSQAGQTGPQERLSLSFLFILVFLYFWVLFLPCRWCCPLGLSLVSHKGAKCQGIVCSLGLRASSQAKGVLWIFPKARTLGWNNLFNRWSSRLDL